MHKLTLLCVGRKLQKMTCCNVKPFAKKGHFWFFTGRQRSLGSKLLCIYNTKTASERFYAKGFSSALHRIYIGLRTSTYLYGHVTNIQ